MVEFADFSLPLNYGSQIQEHTAVRKDAGMFDVSHMQVSDIKGSGAKDYLRYLLSNDVDRINKGKALYSCMLNEKGGIIDDLIVYYLQDDYFRIVSNGATRDKDLSWMQKILKDFNAKLEPREDLSILAVQGPNARQKVLDVLSNSDNISTLGRFYAAESDAIFVSRTGYTGEDGFEIITDGAKINTIWDSLVEQGITACGLGARDSLRLEAGMMLYGSDMDESNHPFESGLKWTVSMTEREFSGKNSLENILKTGVPNKMIGLTLQEKGIMRHGQEVFVNNAKVGQITSGGFSPMLEKSIAFARVHKNIQDLCQVKIRDKFLVADVGSLDFVKYA